MKNFLENDENIYQIMQYLSELHFVPLYYFRDERLALFSNAGAPEIDGSVLTENKKMVGKLLHCIPDMVQYFCDENEHRIYYAALRLNSGEVLAIGPASEFQLNTREAYIYLRIGQIRLKDAFIPHISRGRALKLLSLAGFILTGKEPENSRDDAGVSMTDTDQVREYQYEKMDSLPHFPYLFAEQLIASIADGDYEAAQKLRVQNIYSVGKMGNTPLKEKEYEAVMSVTSWMQIAIQNGVNAYEAFDLNDLYLQRISTVNTIEEYENIIYEALCTICANIRHARKAQIKSAVIEKCKSYIARNLTKGLNLKALSDYIGLSQAYLSSLFSKTEGIPVKQYINREKLIAAEHMLRFSDYNVSEISSYLNFTSQSYFSSLFKRKYGCTPTEYRRIKWMENR